MAQKLPSIRNIKSGDLKSIEGAIADIKLILQGLGATGAKQGFLSEAGGTVDGALGAATLLLTGAPPAAPVANTLYKDPTPGAVGFAVPMDPASALPSIAGVLTAASGGIAAGELEGWHETGAASEPAFANSWVNSGGNYTTCAFRKNSSGEVRLKGIVKNGTVNTTIFTLPARYRPAKDSIFTSRSDVATFSAIFISSGGAVIQVNGLNTECCLDGITFLAEQ